MSYLYKYLTKNKKLFRHLWDLGECDAMQVWSTSTESNSEHFQGTVISKARENLIFECGEWVWV